MKRPLCVSLRVRYARRLRCRASLATSLHFHHLQTHNLHLHHRRRQQQQRLYRRTNMDHFYLFDHDCYGGTERNHREGSTRGSGCTRLRYGFLKSVPVQTGFNFVFHVAFRIEDGGRRYRFLLLLCHRISDLSLLCGYINIYVIYHIKN